MVSTIKIRQAESNDIPAIYQLVKELAEYEKEGKAVTATVEDYLNDFKEGIFECLVAENKNEIIGIAIYYMTYSTWKGKMLYLEDFVVSTNHRRKGIGQQLYNAYLAAAKQAGAKIVKWQVLNWNQPAIEFYKKNNAIIEEKWWNCKIFLNGE